MSRPLVVGLGGTMRADSSSEVAVRVCLAGAERAGATTVFFGARELDFPMYAPQRPEQNDAVSRFLDHVRRADGIVIGTPGYHGGMSGLIKNALDYLEELRDDNRPYLDDRAVGCVVCAAGWQATVTTLASLRSIVHALRGWPTPLGVAVNSANGQFADGVVVDPALVTQLELVGHQVVSFARSRVGVA